MSVELRVGMIDVDLLNNGTRHPNLAQMKMSNYCKDHLHHDVHLIYKPDELANLHQFDVLLVSKVFNYTPIPKPLQELIDDSGKSMEELNGSVIEIFETYEYEKPQSTQLLIGGTGFFEDGGRNLDYEIEHYMPDYSLYDEYVKQKISEGRDPSYYSDYKDVSIGFLTRGCFRKCSFCVNKKYDRAFVHYTGIREFYNENCKVIYLWDDNFFALGKGCIPILEELNELGKPFQFRQGLDIRLMTPEFAQLLSRSKYYGDFIFAFDHIQDTDRICKKLTIWRQYCKKETKLYVLCGYDARSNDPKYGITGDYSIDEKDLIDIRNTFERISILMKFGCLPYIMRHILYKESRYKDVYVQLSRWCNQPAIFKKMSFEEFCLRNQLYVRTDRDCAAVRALKLLKQDAPDIYEKYAKLKFVEEKEYRVKPDYLLDNVLNDVGPITITDAHGLQKAD